MLTSQQFSRLAIAATSTFFSTMLLPVQAVRAQTYTFTVTNHTSSSIVELWASEDGESWAQFTLDGAINPGETQSMYWDDSTNNSGCVWYIQAVNDDGSLSDTAPFDFCEYPDLVLE